MNTEMKIEGEMTRLTDEDEPYPFDSFPEDFSTWEECVRQFKQARAEIARLEKQHTDDCHDMNLVRSGLVKHSREFVRMHDENHQNKINLRLAIAYLNACKKQFAPNTTNSDVDLFLEKVEKFS